MADEPGSPAPAVNDKPGPIGRERAPLEAWRRRFFLDLHAQLDAARAEALTFAESGAQVAAIHDAQSDLMAYERTFAWPTNP